MTLYRKAHAINQAIDQHTNQKTMLFNKLSLSMISLILGFFLWHAVSQSHKITATLALPVSCYTSNYNTNYTDQTGFNAYTHNYTHKNNNDLITQLHKHLPETVSVTVYGTRTDLYKLAHTGAVHIDADKLKNNNLIAQKKIITLSQQHLFLPESVTLLYYSPETISI